jgi:hypothetical protein
MSDYDIHSCGYYCDRPACVKAQRDKLRDKLFEIRTSGTFIQTSDSKPSESARAWVGLTHDERIEVSKNLLDQRSILELLLRIEEKLKAKNA